MRMLIIKQVIKNTHVTSICMYLSLHVRTMAMAVLQSNIWNSVCDTTLSHSLIMNLCLPEHITGKQSEMKAQRLKDTESLLDVFVLPF